MSAELTHLIFAPKILFRSRSYNLLLAVKLPKKLIPTLAQTPKQYSAAMRQYITR